MSYYSYEEVAPNADLVFKDGRRFMASENHAAYIHMTPECAEAFLPKGEVIGNEDSKFELFTWHHDDPEDPEDKPYVVAEMTQYDEIRPDEQFSMCDLTEEELWLVHGVDPAIMGHPGYDSSCSLCDG